MAKNKNNPQRDADKTTNHYKLNTKAVDRLVNANKMEIPADQLNKDPGKKFRGDFLDRIPSVVKALFIKFWFNGAFCFFIFWGLGLSDSLDMIIIGGIALGMITDILVNNALRFLEVVPGENAKWMMFPKKKYWTFFANILYSMVVLFVVAWFYTVMNVFIASVSGGDTVIGFAAEPFSFGLLYMIFDLFFVGAKHLFIRIINDAKNKVNKE